MERKIIEEFDKQQKFLKQKRQKASAGNVKKKPVKEEERAQPSTSYRDRARERREGINKDFEIDPDDLKISNPIVSNATDDNEGLDDSERRRIQIEESKFLGGDVEHTHLVKGLDFALLEKVKSDQKLVEKLERDRHQSREANFEDSEGDSEEEEFRAEAILAASSLGSRREQRDIEKLKAGKSTQIIPCRTALARRILNVFDEQPAVKTDLFLPGRMNYILPLDEDNDDDVITVLRSKADAASSDDTGINECDIALDQLINILARVRRTTSSDTSKKLRAFDIDDDYGY